MATHPSWIQEEFERRTQGQTETLDETARERHLQKAAQTRWEQLISEFRQDIEDYTRQAGPTEFVQASEIEFRVQRPPLTLAVQADIPDHRIYYSYEAEGGRAAAPDGGILSIRLSRYGRADLYSSDERLDDEEIRRMLLEPVLFPDEPTD